MAKEDRTVTVVRRSCLTGKIVWVYRGPSKTAARMAYMRACRKEIKRVEEWDEYLSKRAEHVFSLLKSCMNGKPNGAELTPEQKAAAKYLSKIAKKGIECYRGFYDHIVEERRRRAFDSEIRRQMRERESENNRNYDK